MRALLVLPALVLMTACSAPKLTRAGAEEAIRRLYPVDVIQAVPATDRAIKGSPQHAQLVAFQEHLGRMGFQVERKAEGDWDTFAFKAPATLPQGIRSAGAGFELVVGKAEFVKAIELEKGKPASRVTYQVRLAQPTTHFPLFQHLNPKVKVGDTKERHAFFSLEKRTWVLRETDEKGRKS